MSARKPPATHNQRHTGVSAIRRAISVASNEVRHYNSLDLDMSRRRGSSLGLLVAIAIGLLVHVTAGQVVNRSSKVALYAGVGEELITFSVDVGRATLTRQSSTLLPGFVQEAWASPATPFLYVAWSNGGASYNGSSVAPVGDRHGVTAFRLDGSGALHAQSAPGALR